MRFRSTLLVILLAAMLVPTTIAFCNSVGDVDADLAKLNEAYEATSKKWFRASDEMNELERLSNKFIESWEGTATSSQLATAGAYRALCWLTAKKYDDTMGETKKLLVVEDLLEGDRVKLLYYRGAAAVKTGDMELAEKSLEELLPLDKQFTNMMKGAIRQGKVELGKKNVKPGMAPPPWTLPRIGSTSDEAPLKLESLRGKYVLLDFWASWCGPCIQIMASDLAPMHETWKGDDRFVLVSVGLGGRDTIEKQAAFAKSKSYKWTKVFDANDDVSIAYGVSGIPTLTFIGPDGKIIAHGYSQTVMPVVKRTLATLKDTP